MKEFVIGAVHRTKPSGIEFCCGTPVQESDRDVDAPPRSAVSFLDQFSFFTGQYWKESLYTMYTRLTCKGLDICPIPTDVRDRCFRGGAGA